MIRNTPIGQFKDVSFKEATHFIHINEDRIAEKISGNHLILAKMIYRNNRIPLKSSFVLVKDMWYPVIPILEPVTKEDIIKHLQL